MLTPRYLETLADGLQALYSQLETDILKSIAKRLNKLDSTNESEKHQANVLAQYGGIQKDVTKILNTYTPEIQKEVSYIVKDAIHTNTENNNKVFEKVLHKTVSDPTAQKTLAIINQCYGDLTRITKTTAQDAKNLFSKEADRAFFNTLSGAFNHKESMQIACDELAENGITTVSYKQGKPITKSIESAVRMNILTSINNIASKITLDNCEELECDLVEVSAHLGARPEHAEWQGKVYSRSGKSDKYPPFSICGYGSIDGICGINCRHSFYPYFEGQKESYSDKDLKELTEKTVEYNGQKLTRYEATQKQRHIERQIRSYKRKALIQEAGGVDNTKARVKLGEWQAKARDFVTQTGLRRENYRERIGTTQKQPTGINPSIQSYENNLKKSKEVKRLDNAKNKIISNVKQGKPMNFRQADGGACNPNFNKGGGYKENCQSCVVAYEMRRRGFNVETLPKYKGSMSEVLSYNTSLAWIDRNTGKNPQYIYVGAYRKEKVFENIKNTIEANHRYTMEWVWNNHNFGHIVTINKNKKNELSLYDPQNGINYRTEKDIITYLKNFKPTSVKLLNIQDCDVNINVINGIIKERKH